MITLALAIWIYETQGKKSAIKPAKRQKVNVLGPDIESDYEDEWIKTLNDY